MATGEVPTTAVPRTRTLGPLAVLVIGYLALLFALTRAASAPDAVSERPPTCKGQVMARDAVCEQTVRDYIGRTGRIVWYQDVQVKQDHDQVAEHQDENAKYGLWFWAMVTGTVGTIVVFAGTRWLITWRAWPAAVYLASAALVPLLAATVFVGWSELRFEPDDRPGVFIWQHPNRPAAAVVMLGLVVLGTVATFSGVRYLPSDPALAEVRGRAFAGYPLAGWWERVLARLIDTVVVAIIFTVLSVVVAILAFVVGRPLLGDQTAATVMNATTLVLGFLAMLAYDAQIADERGEGNTFGKRALKLRVLPRGSGRPGTGRVPTAAAYLRALTWWGPILIVAVASTDFGPVGPIPYAYLLFGLPLLNGAWPLWDRGLRQSLNDRLAKTVVVRTS
jgi:RDD family